MLAFAASYGVWSFNTLFVPSWVALAEAAAFEATYIGLSTLDSLTPDNRRRATAISVGAVVVSIIYNSLAGFAHRQPQLFINVDWRYDAVLALLHGAPLALVAYFVADLLLHAPSSKPVPPASSLASLGRPRVSVMPPTMRRRVGRQPRRLLPVTSLVDTPVDEVTREVVRLRDDERWSFGQIGKHFGFSRQAAQKRYEAGKRDATA